MVRERLAQYIHKTFYPLGGRRKLKNYVIEANFSHHPTRLPNFVSIMWKPSWTVAGHTIQHENSNSRSFSTSAAGRKGPQPAPRLSSLTMSSNTSTTSLSGARGAKRSTAAPPTGLRDPLEVLGEILGTSISLQVNLSMP